MSLSQSIEAVAKFMLLPPASLLAIYLLGVLVGMRKRRAGAVLRHGALGLLFFLSSGVGAWLLARPLEAMEQPLLAAPVGAGAIVVLSAGRLKHAPEFGNLAVPDFIALERMSYAANLARRTGLPLLVTGGRLSQAADDEALALGMQRIFSGSFGLPVRWVEAASRTTAENASLSAPLLKRDGIIHIILVTDAMHMYRARRMFERAGLTVTAAPTLFTANGPFTFDITDLLPTMEHLRRSYYAIYEGLGLLRDRVQEA